MANIFGILTAIVLFLAGIAAYKNKAAYERDISETATQKDNLSKSKIRLKTAKDNLKTTQENLAETEADIAKLTEESATQTKANDDLKLQIDAKNTKIASNKQQLDEIREKTAKIGDVKDLAAKMREVRAEHEAVTQTITETEVKLANLTSENTQAESQISTTRGKLDLMSSGQSLPTLNTRIRSIYPTWGFVTLGAGNTGGVATNSTLNVIRDGKTIAQLLVTSVERGSASASIIPDSIPQDVTLMVGDRVVAASKTDKTGN